MSDETHNQVGATVAQLRAVVQAAGDADSDSVLLRTAKESADPAPLVVWLFSEDEEGIVGMIEVDPSGEVTELDE